MKLRRVDASNPRNESRIDFVEADRSDFSTADDFYAEAIRMLWEGFESAGNTEKHIANAKRLPIDEQKLEAELGSAVQTTPIVNAPELETPEEILCMQEDWNIREFVWRDRIAWRMFSWSTSA